MAKYFLGVFGVWGLHMGMWGHTAVPVMYVLSKHCGFVSGFMNQPRTSCLCNSKSRLGSPHTACSLPRPCSTPRSHPLCGEEPEETTRMRPAFLGECDSGDGRGPHGWEGREEGMWTPQKM